LVVIDGLNVSTALPEGLATATLAARLADPQGAIAVLHQPTHFVHA
jgi:ATP-dependent Lhr-like helicase